MRISTQQFFNQSVYNMQEQQKMIYDLQQKISTGKNILQASDDPVSMAQLYRLNDENKRTESHNETVSVAERENRLQDSLFTDAINGLQRVRELALSAHNGSYGRKDFQNVAIEIHQRLGELVQLANTQSVTGEYLFSGYKTGQTPVVADATGRYTYQGDQGQRFVQIGPETQVAVTDSGYELFFDLPASSSDFETRVDRANTGNALISIGTMRDATTWQASNPATYSIIFNTPSNTFDVVDDSNPTVPLTGLNNVAYTSGNTITIQGVDVVITGTPNPGDVFHLEPPANQDVFTTIQKLYNALNTAPSLNTELIYRLDQSLTNIDEAMNVLNAHRSEVGARLNIIDSQKEVNDSFKLWTTEAISDIQDVDLTSAISDFSMYQSSFEAAQKTFLRVQRLSLFEIL